jgi:hypothetical protein
MPWDHVQSIKKVLKHVAFRTRLHGLVAADRKQCGFHMAHLDQEAPSDRGSEVGSTASLAKEPGVLDRLGCQTLLDIGGGDWNGS